MGLDGHWAAIVKIQATWRMAMQRKKYMETCVSKTAAKVILEFRRKCLARAKFYERVLKQLEAHTSTVSLLRTTLVSTYASLHPSAAWHVHIHLPSASLPDRVRFMMKDVTPYQTYHAGRLACALGDRARVVYISPVANDPLVHVAMRYLARSTRYPRAVNRTQVLVPEVLAHVPLRAPLSLSAYASAGLLKKVKETLGGLGPREGVLAVMVPYLVDAYDVRVASLMGVPMLALGVGRQEYFASRVGYFELMAAVDKREMEVAAKCSDTDVAASVPATVVRGPLDGPRGVKLSPNWSATHKHVLGIEDEARVWIELAGLVLAHPKIARWMLKIRDEFGRRGVVVFHRKRVMFGKYVERLELHEVVEKIRAVPEAFTFMPPKCVVDAFGHPAQLYTLQQVAPEGGNATKVVKRNKAPIHLIRSNLGSVPGSVSGSRSSLVMPSAKGVSTITSAAAAKLASRLQTPQHDTSTSSPSPTRPTTTGSHHATLDLPASTTLPTPAYPTVSAYLSSFCKSGGIIEALIDHPNGQSSSASRTFFGIHIELHPTGELQVHATWESVPLHDFDQCLLVLPARQIPPDVLMAHTLKLTPVLIERGIIGHIVVEFLAYMNQQPAVDLYCIDVKPYWSETASLAGLAKIVMDARVDYPSVSGLTGKPLVRQRGRGDARVVGQGVVALGEYITDMSHLRPANLRMATQAKWLDMDRLNAVADQVVKEKDINTGEEARCAVLLSGWVSSVLKEVGWVTMNATLQACEAEMDDTMRRGVLFLGDPHKSALAVDRTVTQCIQSLRDALLLLHHRFQGSPLSEHTCNLHAVSDLLNRMQPVYGEIESPANPMLAAELDAITVDARMHRSLDPVPDTVTSDAYFASVLQDNVPWMKTATYAKLFAAPPAPAKDQEEQSPEAKRTAEDMYAAALLAQEIYNLGRKVAEFSKQGASMTKFNALLNAEIMDTEEKRRVRKKERKRDVKRSLRADREAAMRLAAGGMSVAEAEAAEEKDKAAQRRKSVAQTKGGGKGDEAKQQQQQQQQQPSVGTGSVSGGSGPQIVVDRSHQAAAARRGGDNNDDSDSDSDSSDSSADDGPLSRSSGNTRSPVELLGAGGGGIGGAVSANSVFSSATLGPPTSSQGKLGNNNVLKLMRGMFERVQEKVASSHHVEHQQEHGSGV
ncbi:hypothetical protein BCR44DRAFT_60006 [Catenaria anguillulae PL171]|uniref:IQCH-like ATP-grasp domain-containing protein n=1 Tax=Catenaria anguillulae PL171 TaxID=765915 RepID=A0A1Y2HX27_9FUNG|nr:hypothetical protein BCR44DRAFT_60006 [Catenaria anguillulae PL171]